MLVVRSALVLVGRVSTGVCVLRRDGRLVTPFGTLYGTLDLSLSLPKHLYASDKPLAPGGLCWWALLDLNQ